MFRHFRLLVLSHLIVVSQVSAQLPSGWKAHDLQRPQPPVVTPGESDSDAPSDAIVLFDGSNLSNWSDGKDGEPKWKIVDGAMESVPGSGYVFTREKFGDCQLHVEWAAPSTVKGNGQGRGNSGVYLMGEFEVQVLDSFENPTYADGGAGSLYGQYPPLVNASRKPGQWQAYDIVFHAPRFDDSGKLIIPARMTVFHNGVLIQDNSELYGPTNWIQHKDYQSLPDKAALSLQDHGNPVRYRNIWIRPLRSGRAKPEQPYESESSIGSIGDDAAAKLVGEYDGLSVEKRDGKLFLIFQSLPLEMIALSEAKFEFRRTAGHVEFFKDESGKVESLELHLDAAGTRKAKRKEQ